MHISFCAYNFTTNLRLQKFWSHWFLARLLYFGGVPPTEMNNWKLGLSCPPPKKTTHTHTHIYIHIYIYVSPWVLGDDSWKTYLDLSKVCPLHWYLLLVGIVTWRFFKTTRLWGHNFFRVGVASQWRAIYILGGVQEISNRTYWTDPEKTWVSNNSTNLLRGPLIRSHSIFDGWWFQLFFIFTPILGEMIQFD